MLFAPSGVAWCCAGRNTTHQKKKADMETMQFMRTDLGLSFTDKDRILSLRDARGRS